MKCLPILLSTLVIGGLAAPASARDTRLHLDAQPVIASGIEDRTLDGSVRFYFEGQATPAVLEQLGAASTNRKTNAVGKSDQEACRWVMLGALLALQEAAKARGANAVVGIRSNYKRQEFVSATQYECAAGAIMAGVALKGSYARVAVP